MTLLGGGFGGGPAVAQVASARDASARPCPRHGPGFVVVPGTSTCIRIGGRVRAEYGGPVRRVRREDVVGLGASGRVSLDARSDTEYGPLRAFVRVRVRSDGR